LGGDLGHRNTKCQKGGTDRENKRVRERARVSVKGLDAETKRNYQESGRGALLEKRFGAP